MSGINDQELQGVYSFAVQLGKDAGQMLMDAVQRRIQSPEGKASTSVSYVEKENSVDIVTKTDHGKLFILPPDRLSMQWLIRWWSP
jgi:myo-inositol-1(or 4)-monophosphatase